MESEFTVYGFSAVLVIIGLIAILKGFGLPARFAPAVALVLGIAVGFVYLAPGDPPKAIFLGIVLGLSAVGLYSGTKNTVKKVE